jgi:release factor glutamine methyltransferase
VIHLIARQHRLPSLGWLLSQIEGARLCSDTTLVTKSYSSIHSCAFGNGNFVSEVESPEIAVARHASGVLLLLDEGGGLHAALPARRAVDCAGVEQTTFGLQTRWKCPMILVCRSAAKLIFESQIIARGIWRKLDSLGVLRGTIVGVIGLGALGSEVARTLLNHGVPTVGTDISVVPTDLQPIVLPLRELLAYCDIYLGCTGVDVFSHVDMSSIVGRKTLISGSSSNVEFGSVIKQLPAYEQFGTAQGWIGNFHATVLNGGYPINFDRVREWELFEEIVLTRKLVFEGLARAKLLFGQEPRGVMLDPGVQLRVVNEWLEQVPERDKLRVPELLTEGFFLKYSEGYWEMSQKPYMLHSTTPGALAKMRTHTAPYFTDVMGLPILVLPNVWSPAYDWSSLFYVENFPDVNGLDFLEIGCGTGVISVVAGRNGARRIVAVDVNPDAVRNTQMNFERFGIQNAEAYMSDCFNNVRGLFDIVTWNAPYHGSKPADMLERGCADEEYRDMRAFFADVGRFLKPGGRVIFGFSESGDLPLLEALITHHGFRIKRRLSDWRQGYNCMLFELVRNRPTAENAER